MGDRIEWANGKVRLGDLNPWPRNPRLIREDQAERLKDSFETFGQVEAIAVGPDGEVYNGHQRLHVLLDEHGADYEVAARISSRPLEEKEREKLAIYLHRGTIGEWDFEKLSLEFETVDLLEWGFEEWEIGAETVLGPDLDDLTADRTNNNMQKIGGDRPHVGLQFGDIMVVLTRELYLRVWAYVTQDQFAELRDGMIDLLDAGLGDAPSDDDDALEDAAPGGGEVPHAALTLEEV